MKKSFFLLLSLIFFAACGVFKPIPTVDRLQLSMSKAEVENIFGRPEKVLLVSLIEHGQQEIFAYKIGNDIYTLEFINDQLIRYEFLCEVPRPPMQPVYPIHPTPIQPPTPIQSPPATRPSPLPVSPPVNQGKPEVENTQKERPRSSPGSGTVNQSQLSESARTVESGTTRPGKRNNESGQPSRNTRQERGNVDSGQSNENNRSSDEKTN